jgi:hypothetical protein
MFVFYIIFYLFVNSFYILINKKQVISYKTISKLLVFLRFLFRLISTYYSAFGASAAGAVSSAGVSTTVSSTASVKSSFTSIYLDSIFAPTFSFVLAALPVLFLR